MQEDSIQAVLGPKGLSPKGVTLLNYWLAMLRVGMAENLRAVYIHGSLALGGFLDGKSDLDGLVVCRQALSMEVRLSLAADLVALMDGPGRGQELEFTILTAEHAAAPVHPVPFELHYSPMWHEVFRTDPEGACRPGRRDPDLLCQLAVARQSGVVLFGPPAVKVIGPINREGYLASVWADVADAEGSLGEDPLYAVANLCRTWAFFEDGRILSKRDGLLRAEAALPWAADTAAWALTAWRGGDVPRPQEDALRAFVRRMLGILSSRMPRRPIAPE